MAEIEGEEGKKRKAIDEEEEEEEEGPLLAWTRHSTPSNTNNTKDTQLGGKLGSARPPDKLSKGWKE